MRIQKVICDSCRKEIKENPTKFLEEVVDRDTGDYVTNVETLDNGLSRLDFCPECAEGLRELIRTYRKNTEPAGTSEAVETTEVSDVPRVTSTPEIADAVGNSSDKKKTHGATRKYDHDAIWALHKQGKRNVEIERELNIPKTTVAFVIHQRRKKEAEQSAVSTETKPGEDKHPEDVTVKPEKKPWYNPETMIMEKSDDGRRNVVAKRKPTPTDGQPIKVCLKNCVVCAYSSAGGYCDYASITGESRKDKPGQCTHRKLRK